MLNRVVREDLIDKIHLIRDLKGMKEQAMQDICGWNILV